jgi:predicted DNA-binding protein YlxM (UPF0122 family)
MDELTKAIRYNSLLHLYSSLLSETQREILLDYFGYNLSITEIAQNREVSRAAVEDAIKKGTRKLDSFETSLELYKKQTLILKNTAILKEKFGNCEEIEEIEREIK